MTQTPAEGNSSFVLMLRIAFVPTHVWIRCPRHEQTETITRQIVLLRFPCVEIVRPKVMNGQMNDWMRKLQALARVSERVKVWVRARDERVSARVRARVSSWTNAYLGCVCVCACLFTCEEDQVSLSGCIRLHVLLHSSLIGVLVGLLVGWFVG